MPTHHQTIVEVPPTTGANGSTDTTVLALAYPGSPVHRGELTDATITALYQAELEGDKSDGGHTFGTVDMDFGNAPNLEEVVVGGGGLPGSPWAPNIASPPEGQNPSDIPASGVEATNRARGSGGPFIGDGLQSPSEGSANIGRQRIGSLMNGSSTPRS